MKEPLNSVNELSEVTNDWDVQASFLDEATKQKIQKHLTDINDVITEDDIRRIDTGITLRMQPPQGYTPGTGNL